MDSRKRKLATAGGSVAIVAAAIAMTAGTYSYFSDEADAGTQNIQAGTMGLELGGTAQSAPFALMNMAPGEHSAGRTFTIKNTGSLPGTLKLSLVKDSDAENGCAGPAEVVDDPNCGSSSVGDLGSKLVVGVTDVSTPTVLNNWVNRAQIDLGTLGANETRSYNITTGLNKLTNDLIQGDSTSFHFDVRLDQVH